MVACITGGLLNKVTLAQFNSREVFSITLFFFTPAKEALNENGTKINYALNKGSIALYSFFKNTQMPSEYPY